MPEPSCENCHKPMDDEEPCVLCWLGDPPRATVICLLCAKAEGIAVPKSLTHLCG